MLGRWHLTMSDGNAEGNFSLVWKKLDKHWKIIHDHSSSYEPEKTDSKPEAAKSSKAK
jgi:ketosteroid isomerase-like protein